MKAVVAAFNQVKAHLVGAFSMIVIIQTRRFVSRSSRVPTVCHYGDTGGGGVTRPLRAPAWLTIYWITSSVSVSAGNERRAATISDEV